MLPRTAVVVCLSLSACGGSSGGGSMPVNPILALSTTTVSKQASINEAAGPTATIQLAPEYAPNDVYIGYAYSTNGVSSVVGNAPVRAPSALIVKFQPPYRLKPGTYTDSLQIELCSDAECQQPLTQRQFVTLTYTVVAAPSGQTPAILLSPASLSAQQFLTSKPNGFPEPPPVAVSFANVPATPLVSVDNTLNGVASTAYVASTTAIGGTLTVLLQPPQRIGAGIFHDTVTVRACLDSNCNNPLAPVTLGVTYTVTNTVAGANGYTIDVRPLAATDLVWDAAHGHILIAQPPAVGSTNGSVAILDPTTGALSGATTVNGQPGVLALAADASLLYLGLRGSGSIQRYTLPTMTPDISIPLPNYNGTVTYARTIEVAPDDAHTIAVTLQDASGNPMGLVVFDDAIARVDTFGYVGATPAKVIDSAVWGTTGATLYGSSSASGQSAELYAFTVNAAGVTLATDQPGGPVGGEHFAQNLLYLDGGAVVDPMSLTESAAFAAPKSNLLMTPDVAGQRAFFLNTATATDSFSGLQLESFDLGGMAAIATVPMPYGDARATRLVRWGTAGLAFADSVHGDIVTVSGSFVSP